MADIKTQTREVIQQLSEIARWSETAGQGLDRFAGVLSKLGGTSTQFLPSMTNLISVINEMALSMRELGFSDQHINRVRTSLQAYAAEYGNLANIQGRLASMPRGGPQGPGLIGRLGPSREGRRNAEISRMRQEAANQAREAGRIPIQDIAAAGGDIQRIIGLRREYLAVVNQEQKKLLETAIAQRRLVEIEAKRNQLAAERLALQQQSAGRVFNQRTSAFQARRGAAGAAGGRVGPGGLQGPVTEVQGSLQEITTQFKDFIPGGQVGVENLTNKMNSLGITSARVTSATEELSTGVRTLRFRIDRGNGAVASATVHMDRWGGIMRETGNRFRTFTSAVGNNLVKVVQWGVATGFVYGAMRNLQQTIREITEIEKELANVQVALGKGQGNLNEIFKEAAVIADLTSQSIMGVVESYALAFQATGGLEDMATRGAQANALLTESMVLAQLSGLEQAKAMDTLIGALRQTGMELDEGRELLDKWVAVARESNVSVGTMAETYAIVGAQAKDLGLEFEQLNALAATLAEATPLSATEVGNAMRGILAGFQTTQAEGVLARFGIETRTATGELRNFWELLNEIAELIAAGAISPAEISEISNAIGGGYRRGGQVQIILRGMARSQQLVNEQFDTGGQAADALEIKMATLQSAITRLGNAFTTFAHTLGDEGGVLGVSKLVVEILTSLIGIMDRMTAGLGKATPALVAFGAAMLVLRSSMGESFLARTAPAFLTRAAGLGRTGAPSVQARLAGVTGGSQVSAAGVGGYSIGRSASGIGSRLSSGIGGINPLSGLLAAGIIAPTAIQAAQAAPQERPEAFAKAGAQIAGAIAGGLIGGPIGVVLGSSIGGAFADAVIDEERDIAGRLAETFATQSAENLKDEGIGDEIVSSDIINLLPESIQAAADISAFFARIIDVLPGEQFGHIERPTGKGVVSEDVLRGLLEGTIGTEAIQGMISDEARAEFAKLLAQQMEAGIEEVEVAGAFRTQIERATPAVQAAAGTRSEERRVGKECRSRWSPYH